MDGFTEITKTLSMDELDAENHGLGKEREGGTDKGERDECGGFVIWPGLHAGLDEMRGRVYFLTTKSSISSWNVRTNM